MTPIKRPLAAAGATVLLALSLSACGGGAPTDASKEDFCEVVQGDTNDEEIGEAIAEKDWDAVVDAIKEQADKVEEVGTPEDISDEEREGFELLIEQANDISGDDLEKAYEAGEDGEEPEDPFSAGLSDDEQKKIEAYQEYEGTTCSE